MKKPAFFFLLAGCLAAAAGAQSLTGKTMYVTAKTVSLKSSYAFFAETQGSLVYGDPVTVLDEYGKWVQVEGVDKPDQRGWMAAASLTSKRITHKAVSASANEIALAGKGFNQEVEAAYRKEDSDLNYAAVDAVEAERVDPHELYRFLLEGHLARGEN